MILDHQLKSELTIYNKLRIENDHPSQSDRQIISTKFLTDLFHDESKQWHNVGLCGTPTLI